VRSLRSEQNERENSRLAISLRSEQNERENSRLAFSEECHTPRTEIADFLNSLRSARNVRENSRLAFSEECPTPTTAEIDVLVMSNKEDQTGIGPIELPSPDCNDLKQTSTGVLFLVKE
jgi:hypothetical protein